LSSPAAKKNSLFEQVETAIERRHPVPDKEGRIAIVTTRWARDAMDAGDARDESVVRGR
jgi:hypothetical protein